MCSEHVGAGTPPGYDTFLMLGGGMANHTTYAVWPVSCAQCSAITTANFKQPPLACEVCRSTKVVPVSDPREWKGDGGSEPMPLGTASYCGTDIHSKFLV